MKRTRKWAFVQQEATRLADLGLAPREIATRLGDCVDRSTVQRWMAAGKIRDTRRATGRPPKKQVKRHDRIGDLQTPPSLVGGKNDTPALSEIKPDVWAKTVRKDYSLDATDEQLVDLAQMMLAISRDPLEPKSIRIRAASEYRAFVKQLALVARGADMPQPEVAPVSRPVAVPVRALRRRPSIDPRNVLKAVK